MKMIEKDLLIGAALKQIADCQRVTTIDKIGCRPGRYRIDQFHELQILVSTKNKGPWEFEIAPSQRESYWEDMHTALICGRAGICLLNDAELRELIPSKTLRSRLIRVKTMKTQGFEITNQDDDATVVDLAGTFPDGMFGPSPIGRRNFCWPPLCTLNFYKKWREIWLSTHDRNFDLADEIADHAKSEGKLYMGVTSACPQFGHWTEKNLQKIEKLVRYSLAFDGHTVDLTRQISPTDALAPRRSTDEMVWKLSIGYT